MQTKLKGKAVLITESAHNFGRAIALAFAKEECNLLLASREGSDRLDQITQEVVSLGVKVATQVCDLSDETQVRALDEKAVSEFGRLDVLVNNVLFPLPQQSLEDIPYDLWKRKIEVELTGSFLLCKQVLPGMIQQEWGRVILFTGLAAFNGSDPLSSTTELGLTGLARGIAREYGKHGVTANCLGPAGIMVGEDVDVHPYPPEDHHPLPRWGKPEEVAFLAVCLASEDAGYITGQCLLANGGKYFQ